MKLLRQRQCEVGIDILVFCALNQNDIVTTNDAADFAGTSFDYAHQVARPLTQAALLKGIRGRHGGGIQLGRPACQIKIGDVVRLFEQTLPPDETACVAERGEPIFREVVRNVYALFDTLTIADLANRHTSVPGTAPAPGKFRLHLINSEQPLPAKR